MRLVDAGGSIIGGIPGRSATIEVGDVETGEPGSPASVVNSGSYSAAVLDFVIPTGPAGPVGSDASVAVGDVATGSPASVTNVGTSGAAVLDFVVPSGEVGPEGPVGSQGPAATVSVGSVTTLAAGSPASVVNSGTSGAAVFDFDLPEGDVGPVGAQGTQGIQGIPGLDGDAATITVGSVSTLAPGVDATFVNVGSTSAAVIDVGLPRGAVGSQGSVGSQGPAATVAVGTVSTLPPGSEASVTNVGTSSAAVFDFALPEGAVGSASAETWGTLSGKPAHIAAGATKADARVAVDAEYTGNRGTANGYASLDAGGKVPTAQLPASLMSFQGGWDASANTPTLVDGVGDQGDVYRVTVAGAQDLGSGSISFSVGDLLMCNASLVWEHSDTTDAVASVAGKTGVVTLSKDDVGLGSVDNTSDSAKPISSAAQSALDGKEPSVNAGTSGQYYRGDKSWATLNKSAVGLGSVDNTADLDKPVSSAAQSALDGKEAAVSAGTESDYYRGDKTWVALSKSVIGLGNVDNTSDLGKPVSTATQSSLDGKEPSVTATTSADYYRGDKTFAALNKAAVGLSNVDNTSNAAERAATATLSGKTLTNPTVTDYVESVVVIGTVTTAHTLALTSGTVQTATLTASTACTFTMPTATAGKSFVLLLKQAAATGNGTASFTGVKWTGDAPTVTAAAGKMDIFSFFADGSSWYGSVAAGYTP